MITNSNNVAVTYSLKEKRRLTQVEVGDIDTGFGSVLEQAVIRTKAGVRAKLAASCVHPNNVTGLDEVF